MAEAFEKRFHRLIDMLYLLQGSQGHTCRSLAGRYGVTQRRIERDLEDLRRAHFPLENLGRNRGHRLGGGRPLPEAALCASEVVPLILGNRVLKGRDSALAKLRAAVVNGIERALVAELPDRVAPSVRKNAGERWLESLSVALVRRRRVAFTYNRARREVEPWTLFFQDCLWYLSGYDLGRQAGRTFRLGRMSALEILDEEVAMARPDLESCGFHAFDVGGGAPTSVCVRIDPALEEWLGENPRHPSQVLGSAEVVFTVRNRDRFLDWVLGLEGAELLAPEDWRLALQERLKRLVARYV